MFDTCVLADTLAAAACCLQVGCLQTCSTGGAAGAAVSCAAYGANKPDYATILVPATTADSAKPGLCCDWVSSVPALLMLCEVLILTYCWRVQPTRPCSLLQRCAFNSLHAAFDQSARTATGTNTCQLSSLHSSASHQTGKDSYVHHSVCEHRSSLNNASIFSGWQYIACGSLLL
jgi:hypothetical protein